MFFYYISILIAMVDWIAVAKTWKRVEYFAKPATMIALLAWVGLNDGFQGPMLWFALGLFFSLGGDVFLMLPREQFIAGLVSFLIGHICYLIGFTQAPPQAQPPSWLPTLILTLLVLLAAVAIFRRVRTGLLASGKNALIIPVLAYTIVISLMLISALTTLTRPGWSFVAAILASSGALLFFISDSTLALNKFVAPLPYGRLRVMITYHLGQLLIALGAAIHFIGKG